MEKVFTRLGTIQLSDWWRGLIIAILSAPITIIIESLNAGTLEFDWKKIGMVALVAGLSYISKNLLTGQNGRLLRNT